MAVVGDYGADPDALLEWLSSGSEEMRDMQTMALEHLCMALLMSDNVDRCFETYPPKTFIPPLCMIFLDLTAPDSILEATARALTYYLDVSAECTRRIMTVEGTVSAICNRLMVASLDNQTGKDLAEQCIKVLEHISSRDVSGLVEAGALNAILTFIETYGATLHKDALRSAMGIVTRLCTKVEPSDHSVSAIVQSLTALLKHTDAQVADSALKCFSALAERFARRNGNAEVLSEHGLVDVLLRRLENVQRTSMSLTRVSTSTSESFSSAISVLALIHNLVRESDAVCTVLAQSSPTLSKAAVVVLESDDRCILDLVRVMEVLLVVLLEGRHALPKSSSSCAEPCALRRLDNSNRHLIEIIRNRDFDGLVDVVENGSVDVNLVDDVGQTLLNWCSAFGTQEMCEFLLERGSDANKGQRSSSLHYAACFGRVGVLKVLLQYGADPALKDEDGKTALEKAQERNEEGHSEIVKLLSQPQNWSAPPPKYVRKERLILNAASEQKGLNIDEGLQLCLMLLPLFMQVTTTTMSSAVRRSAAILVQKMVAWLPSQKLTGSAEDFQNAVVKMLSVLMSSEDDDSFAVALDIVDLLATKFGLDFLNSMYSAGIVSQIGGKAAEEKQRLTLESGRSSPSIDVDSLRVQKFGDWYILKGSTSLCLWSDYIIVELPNSSSGSFQTFINGKVSTVRSAAKDSKSSDVAVEGLYLNSSSTESPSQSLKKLTNTIEELRNDDTFSFTTFIGSEATRCGDWVFTSMEGRIMRINNTESTSEVQIRHNLTDTIVVSKAGESSRSLVALSKIASDGGQDSSSSGSLTLGSTDKHKEQAAKRRTQKMALQLYSKYFENAQHNPRRLLGRLMDAVARLQDSILQQKQQQIQHLRGEKLWVEEFKGGVRDLVMAMGDGNILSAYEMLSTDLIKVLMTIFGMDDSGAHSWSMRYQRIELWKNMFKLEATRCGEAAASQILVRSLVKMLEASEKLPVYVADGSLPGAGFSTLTRSIVLKLEMRQSSTQLLDRSGKKMRMEPLVTVREMDDYVWRKLLKRWHDHERCQLAFVRKFHEMENRPQTAALSFSYVSDFDDNGILYWVGTNGKMAGVEWVNPVASGLMAITSCGSKVLPCGSVSDIVSRSPVPLYVRSADMKDAWFTLDTGLMLEPSHYTLRHGRGSGALRNWLLQASTDASTWLNLRSHTNDTSLSTVGSTSTWHIPDTVSSMSCRYFRLQMLGENSEFETCMCISGFELYGVVTGVCDDIGKVFKEAGVKRLRNCGRDISVKVGRLEAPTHSSSAVNRVSASRAAVQHRVSDSTLSLPEASGFAAVPLVSHATEQQALSTDHIHRHVQPQPSGILRTMPNYNLSRFGGVDANNCWQLSSTVERELAEEEPISLSRVSESNGSVSQEVDLPLSSTSSEYASTSQLTTDLCAADSQDSTPVGSSLSLCDSVDYNTAALNQLSLSAPNLACHSHSLPSESSSRFSHLRLLGRGLRTAFSNLQSSRPDPPPQVREEADSASSLSAAQSYPTLTQQQVLLDPLRFAPNSRTRAFLAALRHMASDGGSSSSHVHLDLREALDLTFGDDGGAEGGAGGSRDSEAFVTLADFAYRTLQGSRDSEMTEEGSSEEEAGAAAGGHEVTRQGGGATAWNEDYVLKRQFASLIPNFDPRPGRNNVSQTMEVDVECPAPSELGSLFANNKRKDELNVCLSLRMSGTTSQGEVFPVSPDENVLSMMQRLWLVCDIDPKQGRCRKNWDSTLSLVYGDKNLLSTSESRSSNSSSSVVYPSCNPSNPEVVADILHVLRNLADIASPPRATDCQVGPTPGPDSSAASSFVADAHDFHCGKIASKMLTHLNNYGAVAADPSALPPWCDSLMTDYPFVLPYETRRSCFAATALGSERTIVWLQSVRQQQQQQDTSRSGKLEALLHNFRLGRLLHLRIRKVSRHHILDSAMAALFRHGHSKSVLEIEFDNEEGTGLGPTLEFFSLIAAELQRKDLAMWICDDQQMPSRTDMVDLGCGWKFPGFYVSSAGGLFPAPYPPEHPALAQLKNLYRLLGLCVGKALMDDRLLDLPLSPAFFKMICSDGRRPALDAKASSHHAMSSTLPSEALLLTSVLDTSSNNKKHRRQQRRHKKNSLRAIYRPSTAPWFGVLALDHLEQIDPHRGRFIRGLLSLIKKRQLITDDLMLNDDQKREKLKTLSFEFANGNRTEFIRLDDLGLTFEFNPASKVFNYLSCDLIAEGDTIPVTIENVDLYIDLTLDFCFNSGIRSQMEAFKEGLEQVLAVEKLWLFTAEELRTHLCGEQTPTWTRNDILQFTEPKLGYTHDSPTYKRFVNVLANLTPDERKAFVYFVTGSSSLPPGGLANLFPRLTVVKKVCNTDNEGYPSVNTCVHFLKLPEYSSEQILYERLMVATRERGFYYN